MNINLKTKYCYTPFGELQEGDTFYDVTNEIYAIKVENCGTVTQLGSYELNAVNLQTGSLLGYLPEEDVVCITMDSIATQVERKPAFEIQEVEEDDA